MNWSDAVFLDRRADLYDDFFQAAETVPFYLFIQPAGSPLAEMFIGNPDQPVKVRFDRSRGEVCISASMCSNPGAKLWRAALHYARVIMHVESFIQYVAEVPNAEFTASSLIDRVASSPNRGEIALNMLMQWDHYSVWLSEWDRMASMHAQWRAKRRFAVGGTVPMPMVTQVLQGLRDWTLETFHPHRGWVYVIREASAGHYKIGKTKDPDDRIATFNVKLPFKVEYKALIPTSNRHSLETELHRFFQEKRINGEWFALTDKEAESLNIGLCIWDVNEMIGRLRLILGRQTE